MALYLIANGVAPGAAAQIPVTTGTVIKTMLQVQPSATKPMRVVEWGISFNGSAAATPVNCELIQCAGAATVTTLATADIHRLDGEAILGGDPVTNLILVGTSATGFTASVEGSPTSVNVFDTQFIAPTNQSVKQFPLGREPILEEGTFMRIRVTVAAAIDALCYVVVEV